ncbi:hypothetical protein OEW28_02170 [Defluviimonas sp. WL0002]|uniref:Uncharacterized protein n=1 Tax=Albidovulum marisflavi TaxID=2984159 RepID=A0ABT2Z8G4_9RHOB|nr:hypothetical protein [Defluviimonas sp. WL0002]MCV2867428.1 hypothetical protein [Defluviimonas sp. WL0002]
MTDAPRRERGGPRTVTRDSVSWKVFTERSAQTGALEEEDIRRLCQSHDIDEQHMRQLSRELLSTFGPELHLYQPELATDRQRVGQKKLSRAIDLVRSAEGKLHEASRLLSDIGFANPFANAGVPNPRDQRLQQFDAAIATISECNEFYVRMEQARSARYRATPDARKAADVRREILCVTLFNLWQTLGRNLTYTTDPLSGVRSGPLIEFVNDVVQCLTDPPARLNGEAIKRELEDFRA